MNHVIICRNCPTFAIDKPIVPVPQQTSEIEKGRQCILQMDTIVDAIQCQYFLLT
jgi:hypothetical protein